MFKDIIGKLFKKKITVYYKKLRPEAQHLDEIWLIEEVVKHIQSIK